MAEFIVRNIEWSVHTLKYLFPFLNNETLFKFSILNRKYNKFTIIFINQIIRYNYNILLNKISNIYDKILDNNWYDWNKNSIIIRNDILKIKKYLLYINRNNKDIIDIINMEYYDYNIYKYGNKMYLFKLFGFNQNNNNIKEFSKKILENIKKECKYELFDSLIDRSELSNNKINTTYFYLNKYIGKEIYNISKNNGKTLYYSWEIFLNNIKKHI